MSGFQKGYTPWNKGKKLLFKRASSPQTEQHRKNIGKVNGDGRLRKYDYSFVVAEYEDMKSMTQIARELGTTATSILYILRKMKVALRSTGFHRLGMKQSEETKRKRAEKLKGHRVNWEAMKKLLETNRTRIRTPEERLKMSLAQKGKYAGEKHPNWQGGKSFEEYPQGWRNIVREQIRNRDGRKCKICGTPEMECTFRLDVHHIDYDKKNVSLDNLITLCRPCHRKTNWNRDHWKEIFSKKKEVPCV